MNDAFRDLERRWSRVFFSFCFLTVSSLGHGLPIPPASDASQKQPAYAVFGQSTSFEEAKKQDQGTFFDLESKIYGVIERQAKEKFLDEFWKNGAKKAGLSVDDYRKKFLSEKAVVSDKELKDSLKKFAEHLVKFPEKEREEKVRQFLQDRKIGEVLEGVFDEALRKKEIVIFYPKPEEPVYDVKLTKDDFVRYGPNASDTKPVGCEGEKCPIVIIEYSEYQCPFCSRVLPDVARLLKEYKGKIVWSVRDFPLVELGHSRATPAAIAAKCSGLQGKFWEMYYKLFENQSNLGDSDLEKYASELKLDKNKFKTCFTSNKEVKDKIEANKESGHKYGVNGTPAFFINGVRLSGALPYEEFKRVIVKELDKKNKK